MKAKELAEELLKNPDFDVECSVWVYDENSRFPNISTLRIDGIADIGYSDKVIVLNGEIED